VWLVLYVESSLIVNAQSQQVQNYLKQIAAHQCGIPGTLKKSDFPLQKTG